MPLMRRLGYSIVDYHHSSREFGKDIICGEVDRLGAIRYSIVQAKFQESISKSEMSGIIEQAKESFAVPFQTQNSKAEHRTGTFILMNAGSISEEARIKFQETLTSTYGGCFRLIDGTKLLDLDRSVAQTDANRVTATLAGLRLEVLGNHQLYAQQIPTLTALQQGTPTADILRPFFRTDACFSFLRKPFPYDEAFCNELTAYSRNVMAINAIIEPMLGLIAIPDTVKQAKANNIAVLFTHTLKSAQYLLKTIEAMTAELGPITTR